MKFKKNGKVLLTKNEEATMIKEIERQLKEYDIKHANEIDALVLWHLHTEFGFGPKRLRRFYDSFANVFQHHLDGYSSENTDDAFKCTQLLKEYGIDICKWNEELRNGSER